MKKQLSGLMAILTIFGACQKNDVTSLSENVTIHAAIEDNDATRTAMDENNNILWSENDQLIAFMKSSYGQKYQVKPSFVGKSYADFSLVSAGNGSDLSAGNEWEHNVVYYPYSENIECLKSGANYALDVNLPSEQVYVPDSFANGSMAMVAVSESNNIVFKNVLGGIKLKLRGTQKVSSIKIEGKNDEELSGAAVVTAYTDGTKPAVTISSGASTSVTLNCGAGVQLNGSTATDFIIALPPVLFSKGFAVTVTDADSKTYTVSTDRANTVLRSSLLVMPAFKLGDTPDQGGNDDNLITNVIFTKTSLTLAPGTTYIFETDVDPYDASDKTLSWISSEPSVVSVDQSGKIVALADGTAVISAVAVGGASASCTVKVISCTVVPSVDYVDEYGVNHGKGIAVGNTVWAPVNCGYKAATPESKGFPYGKLYQWGRKYGHGYSTFYDESQPERVKGPVMPSEGQAESNADKFYYNSQSPYDWSKVQNNDLWNSGTSSSPVKTKYDPCPEGWRVPVYSELNQLFKNYSSFGTDQNSQRGRWFSGDYTYLEGCPKVFFPAAGAIGDLGYIDEKRETDGFYWSSGTSKYKSYAWHINNYNSFFGLNECERVSGYSVRCVQE